MAKSPLILAALAKDAVPQLDFREAYPLTQGHSNRFDSAVLTATDGHHYVVRQAITAADELTLDTELVVLQALAPYRAHLPFDITKLVGETKDGRGRRALVFTYVYGETPDFSRIRPTSPFVTSFANALNAIHSLPLSVIENNGLPSYDASTTVRELVNDLDRAAQTGMVPAQLLTRWEQALEDVNLWRFQPSVIHGEASAANFLESDETVSAVLGWENLRIGDPAQDLAWLHGWGSQDFAYSTTLEYERLRGGVDENLRARAQLYSEMEYALYLMGALRQKDEQIIADARHYLTELVEQIESGAIGSIGPKPLGTDAFLTDTNSFGNAPMPDADLSFPAGFIDVAQSVVSSEPVAAPVAAPVVAPIVAAIPVVAADPEFDLPEFLGDGAAERDPSEVDPLAANIFRPVVDSSYNHQNLFGNTQEIPVVGQAAAQPAAQPYSEDRTEPIQVVSDDATAPIPVVTEETVEPNSAEKPNQELF